MDTSAALKAFAADDNTVLIPALRWSFDHWDEAFPAFLSLLETYPVGVVADKDTSWAAYFILHLCGDMAEKRVFPVLCRQLLSPVTADDLLGDATTETLAGILIRTYAGDVAPLMAVIETPGADEFVRDAALKAMAYLTRSGAIPEMAMRFHLAHLANHLLPRTKDFVWVGLATAIAALGYADLRPIVHAIYEEGLIDDFAFAETDFEADLQRALNDPTRMAVFHDHDIKPHTDTIAMIEMWAARDEKLRVWKPKPEPRYENPDQRIVRHRNVGRNDPCPCGSGKKHKKCCLMAA